MIQTLRSHRQKFSWDLADDCFATCSDLVDRITSYPNMNDGAMCADMAMPYLQDCGDISQSALDELIEEFPGLVDIIGI